MHRLLPLALVLGLAVGCAADPTPVPLPSTHPSPTVDQRPRTPTVPPTTPPPASQTPAPTLSRSPTGLEWSLLPLPLDPAYSTVGLIDVTVLDGTFLAVGTGWQENQAGVQVNVPLFWLSDDGRSWQLAVDAGWSEGYVDAVTAWQDGFVAAGYVGDERASAAFWTSSNGRSWERLPDQAVLEFFRGATEGRDIVAGGISALRSEGDELVAVGWLYCACGSQIRDAAVEWRTSDGEEWQRRDLPAGDGTGAPIAIDAGWLRINADGATIEISADGNSWRPAWQPTADATAVQLFALEPHAGGVLAVGARFDGGVARPLAISSVDGTSWAISSGTAMDDVEGTLAGAAASDGDIVAIGRVGDPPQPYVWLHQPASALQADGR